MKKFILISLAVVGLAVASAPRSEAGVSVGIGFGVPVAYGCYPYPSYYPYGYPYGYYPYRAAYRPFYWYHGRRVYYARRPYWRR